MSFAPLSKGGRIILKVLCAGLIMVIGYSQAPAATPNESDYYNMLKRRFDTSPDLYAKALIGEFAIFKELYPQSAKADSVEYFLAVLYEQEKMEAAALANFLKIVYVYPASPFIPECLKHLKSLAESRKKGITALFADNTMNLLKDHVLKIVGDELTFAGGMRGYLDFLQLISDAKVKDLAGYMIEECQHYLYRLGYDLASDRVMVIRGNMFSLLEDWHRAILSYRTAEILNPYGDAVGEAILNVGEIYLRHLGNYRMARNSYLEVIEKFPADIVAARSSVFLAEVDQAEKNYGQAVVQLEDTAKRFPFPDIRMECYARIGWIYLENMNNPEKSIAFYERLVEEFPKEGRSAEALLKIGEIHEKKTKNYDKAVSAYRRLAELFPDNPLTPQYLLQAADLARDRLKNQTLANSLYEQLVKSYPESEPGKKAAKILEKK
ncbi:MAG TPA: tetratricopeptide repeat protein [archaeon]|nr:tetratricopeptide repeat protein [archaeon]